MFFALDNKNKETVWKKSITALAYCLRPHENENDGRNQKMRIEDIDNAAKLSVWWSQHSDSIKAIPLAWVWCMMICYINAEHISIQKRGHNTKFFSEIKSDLQDEIDTANLKVRNTMQKFIRSMPRNQYDESKELISALFDQMRISQQKLSFSPALKQDWLKFIQQVEGALVTYANAYRYRADGGNVDIVDIVYKPSYQLQRGIERLLVRCNRLPRELQHKLKQYLLEIKNKH